MGALKLLAPDETTVLFDFDDPTGAANPSSLITSWIADPDFGTISPALDVVPSGDQGSELAGWRHEPVELEVAFNASAPTDDALWSGLGTLARYLAQAGPDHPVYLLWTEVYTEGRVMTIVGAVNLPQLYRGQAPGGLIAARRNSLGGIPLRLLRQPWMDGPAVTTTARTAPNDPSATGTPSGLSSRAYLAPITGDLPTPARIRVQMDAGAAVDRALLAARSQRSYPATVLSDYTAATGWLNLDATNRGWTITLGDDTASIADAGSIGGNAARIQPPSLNTLMKRRVTATRTASMDSLRGSWDVWVRWRSVSASKFWAQLRWGPSTAEPPPYAADPVPIDLQAASAFVYHERKLGRIDLPTDRSVTLSGLRLELWAQREVGAFADHAFADAIWLTPADTSAEIRVEGETGDEWTATALVTPPAQITGDPVWASTGSVVNARRLLNAVNEGVGTPPNTGLVWGSGRHTVTVDFADDKITGTVKCRVVRIDTNAEIVARTQVLTAAAPADTALTFDGVAGALYQVQAVVTAYTSGAAGVYGMSRSSVAALASGESFRTDPGRRYTVDRLDGSGNVNGYGRSLGPVPAWLWPGDNHLLVRVDHVPPSGYGDVGENVLARIPTVSVTYRPRYAS